MGTWVHPWVHGREEEKEKAQPVAFLGVGKLPTELLILTLELAMLLKNSLDPFAAMRRNWAVGIPDRLADHRRRRAGGRARGHHPDREWHRVYGLHLDGGFDIRQIKQTQNQKTICYAADINQHKTTAPFSLWLKTLWERGALSVQTQYSSAYSDFHSPCRLQYSYAATTSSPSVRAKTATGLSPGFSAFLWRPSFVSRRIHWM